MKNEIFNTQENFADTYFQSDYLLKKRKLFEDCCLFCDQNYTKILKFHLIHQLTLSSFIARTRKLCVFGKLLLFSQSRY